MRTTGSLFDLVVNVKSDIENVMMLSDEESRSVYEKVGKLTAWVK